MYHETLRIGGQLNYRFEVLMICSMIAYVLSISSECLHYYRYYYYFQVGTLILAYTCCLILFWKPELKYFYSVASVMVWIALSSYICGFFSYLRFITFIFLQLTVFGCYFYSTITGNFDNEIILLFKILCFNEFILIFQTQYLDLILLLKKS